MRQPTKFGKYLLLERIAVGGMAEVFVAKAFGVEGFERLLAIKKILPTMGEDEEFISMFVDEARISVQLSHANIVQVLELGKHDENLYIAMEYISGRDVRQLLERFRKRQQPMPIPQACLVAARICEALDYAHRKRDARGQPLGIVHRDVSPQNVIVSFDGEVKLIDFGIAKAESRLQKTQAGILKGKFSYMSPEQVRGQSIDSRSDIFAAGVLIWEMLCGEKLFAGDSDFAILEKVRNGIVPNPRSVSRAIPEALERVVLKALAAEVKDRYQTASELHDDLLRFTLIGDTVYGSRQLAEWMREEFAADFEKEQGRLRQWVGVEDDVEVTPSDPIRRKPAASIAQAVASVSADALFQTPLDPYAGPAALAAHQALPQTPDTEPTQQWRVPADADTLVQPPTPVKSKAPTRDDTPRAAAAQELPTMKMDGEALVQAEREFAARRAGADAAPVIVAPPPVEEEPTNVDPVPSVVALDLVNTAPPTRPPLDLVNTAPPTRPPLDLVNTAPPTRPPGSRPPPMTPQRGSARVPPAASASKPPPAPLFDNSGERTGAPRAQRKGPMSRPQKDAPEGGPRKSRWVLFALPVVLALVAATAFLLLPGDGPRPGKVIVTPSPSVQGDLYIDGKAAGPVPPFVHTVSVGKHRIEVRADGYKSFSAVVTVPAGGRPLEVDAQLVADGPMEVEGVVLTQPKPAEKARPPEEPPAKKKAWWAHNARSAKRAPVAAEPASAKVAAPLPPPEEPGPRLRIVTDPPGADITVDGKPLGKSPVTTDLLNPGPYHPVVASLDGYAPARRAARLDPTGVTELRLSLAQQEAESAVVAATGVGYLTAATKPAARVTIDGRETGRWTPVPPANPIALPAGAHTIVFETADGKKIEEQLQVEAGKTARMIRSFP